MGMLMHRHQSYRDRHKTAAQTTEPAAEPQVVELRLNDMTVKELRAFGAGQGVDVKGLTRKGELITAIDTALIDRANAELAEVEAQAAALNEAPGPTTEDDSAAAEEEPAVATDPDAQPPAEDDNGPGLTD